jgi:hypothetical protein
MTMFEPPDMPDLPKTPAEMYLVRDLEKEFRNGLPGHTYGRLFIGNPATDHVCETHEGQDRRLETGNGHKQSAGTAIPCGRWRVTLHNCRQNGQVPILNAVPGFQGVQILKEHSNHLMPGAIVVGEHRHIAGVSMSVLPFNRLVAYIRQKTMQGIPVYLNVSRAT